MRALRLYQKGLGATLTQMALPYGFTLSIWSSGEIVRHFHPPPGLGDIFLFLVGAAAAYGLLRVVVRDVEVDGSGVGKGHVLRAGTVHLAAIFGGAGVAAALAQLPVPGAWPVTPFGATLVYLTVVAVEQTFEQHQS